LARAGAAGRSFILSLEAAAMVQCRNALSHVVLLLSVLSLLPAALSAQPFPPVADIVSHIDQHCYRMPPQHPVGIPLTLSHLNPIFVQAGLPKQDVVLNDPQELCVPVQKEDEEPPTAVLKVVRWLDWECFGITGPSLDFHLLITQLNPVIQHLLGPRDDLIVREPQQLCVPVAKNGVNPPDEVIRLIEHLDVECFRVDARNPVGGQTIRLTHQNPLLEDLPSEVDTILPPRAIQLCVPVAKKGDQLPDDILPYVQLTDVLCYNLDSPPLSQLIKLSQLNPVLVDQIPQIEVGPFTSRKLCVPVTKRLPPV
jgi:hypothetical protein